MVLVSCNMYSTKPIVVSKYVENKAYNRNWQAGHYLHDTKKIAPDSEGSVFYQVMKPLIFLQRILGAFPYFIHKDTVQVKGFSMLHLFSAAFFGLQVVMLCAKGTIGDTILTNSTDQMFSDMLSYIIFASEISNLIIMWFKTPYIARYFRKWKSFENDLRGQDIFLKKKYLRMWVKWGYTVGGVLFYITLISHIYFIANINLYFIPLVVLAKLNTFLFAGLYMNPFFFIISTSSDLITRAKNCRRTKDIAACRILWLTLSELTVEIGNIMATSIILYISAGILHLLRRSYFFVLYLQTEWDIRELHWRLFFIIAFCSATSFYFELGHRCTCSVGSDMMNELVRLSFLPQEREFQREVNLFIETISYRYPDIDLLGFLRLNRELYLPILSGTITYLIILVQFRVGDKE